MDGGLIVGETTVNESTDATEAIEATEVFDCLLSTKSEAFNGGENAPASKKLDILPCVSCDCFTWFIAGLPRHIDDADAVSLASST